MVTTPKIVEDERDPVVIDRSPPSRWVWLLVGLLLGIGGSVVLYGVGPVGEPMPSTTIPSRTASTLGGIGTFIDGFPDGLMVVTRSDGQSLEMMVWPLRGDPYERAIPVGSSRPPGPVVFDESARRIATLLPVPDQEFGVLYAGIPENAAIVADDVTGFAWHDSTPYELAYSTFADGELLLWVTGPGRARPELVARAEGIDGEVAAWGDWGFAVQDHARDQVVLFTEGGEIKAINPGRALTSYQTGWIAVEAGEIGLLSAGGGVRGLDREGLEGDVLAAAFSRDGEKLALLTRNRVLVVSLEDDSELIGSGGDSGVAQVTWSSDGRFALYPGSRGLWVVDTQNGDAAQLLENRTVTGLGVAPVSGT